MIVKFPIYYNPAYKEFIDIYIIKMKNGDQINIFYNTRKRFASKEGGQLRGSTDICESVTLKLKQEFNDRNGRLAAGRIIRKDEYS